MPTGKRTAPKRKKTAKRDDRVVGVAINPAGMVEVVERPGDAAKKNAA